MVKYGSVRWLDTVYFLPYHCDCQQSGFISTNRLSFYWNTNNNLLINIDIWCEASFKALLLKRYGKGIQQKQTSGQTKANEFTQTHTRKHIHTYTQTHTHTHTNTHTNTHVQTHIHTHKHKHKHRHTHNIYKYIYTYTHAHTYTHRHTHTYTHTHTHTHTRTHTHARINGNILNYTFHMIIYRRQRNTKVLWNQNN